MIRSDKQYVIKGTHLNQLEKVFYDPIEGRYAIQLMSYIVGKYWRRDTGHYDIKQRNIYIYLSPKGIKHIEELEASKEPKEVICLEIANIYETYVQYAFNEIRKELITREYGKVIKEYCRLDKKEVMEKLNITEDEFNSIIYLPY